MSYGQILIPAVFCGVVAAGGVYSAASPSSTVAELERQISLGKSNLVICGSEHRDVVRQAAKQCGVPLSRVLVAESFPSYSLKSLEGDVDAISDMRLQWKRITDPRELKKSVITILWSSGTTGLPKGVSLSHLNLVAETYIGMIQNRMFVAKVLEADPNGWPAIEYRTLGHLPISHIAGFMSYLIIPMYMSGAVYWMRKYNWPDLVKYMREYKITAFYTVPSIYLRISKSPEARDAFQHVVAASTGAAPMDSALQTSSNAQLGDGKTTFIGQTWGLSETTGAVTAIPTGQPDTTGCIGYILPNCELRMVDDNYNDVEPGQEGELLIRAPMVMEGYWNNEQATKDTFYDFKDDDKGPWFCSGDIGVMRDGKFYVVDRKKELLKYKGLQVAPAELENLLFTHPAVAEAAVVGVPAPDDPGTDLPRAYIVLKREQASGSSSSTSTSSAGQDSSKQDTLSQTRYSDTKQTPSSSDTSKQDTLSQTGYVDRKGTGSAQQATQSATDSSKQDTLSQTRYMDVKSTLGSAGDAQLAEELKKYVADRLAQHKQLRGGIKFVPEIPKNAIGKFLRRDLRVRAKKEFEEERGIAKAKL